MRNRSIKLRRARRPQGPIELDITALLDVFIVLLVFLVYSYHSSGLLTSTATSIALPTSTSTTLSGKAVSVQVSTSQIWVDEKEVLNSQSMNHEEVFDREGKKIVPLYNQLIKLRERSERSQELSARAIPFTGDINLVVDKTLKYNYLKRIMMTCAAAGFKNMRFVVASDLK